MRDRGRGRLDPARRECWNREKLRTFCHGHALGRSPQREKGIRAIYSLYNKS